MRTDDPLRDFMRHEREMQRLLEECPRCAWCGQRIQDEFPKMVDGEYICDDCAAIPD